MVGFLRETLCSIEQLFDFLRDTEQYKEILGYATALSKFGYSHTLATAWKIPILELDSQTMRLADNEPSRSKIN
jgi:hypothetical protein